MHRQASSLPQSDRPTSPSILPTTQSRILQIEEYCRYHKEKQRDEVGVMLLEPCDFLPGLDLRGVVERSDQSFSITHAGIAAQTNQTMWQKKAVFDEFMFICPPQRPGGWLAHGVLF